MKAVKKIVKNFFYVVYIFAAVLLLLEIAYRYQIIEFYEAELNGLNRKNDLVSANGKRTILLCGDSFTAHNNNYGTLLRDSMKDHRIINASVVGSSIVETSYLAPKRISDFDPDIFIYQVYVGNDLMGIRHNLNWQGSSGMRNVYWWLSERIHVLSYLNYKLGQWSTRSSGDIDKTPLSDPVLTSDEFSVDNYRPREKLYAHEDPFMVSDAVLLDHGREDDLKKLIESFNEIVSQVKAECKVYILVIPHKAQVNSRYFDQMRDIGYQFRTDFKTTEDNYPFLEKLTDYARLQKNIRVLNALSLLRKNDSLNTPMYFQNDEHLNDEGHKVLSQLVAQVLRTSQP